MVWAVKRFVIVWEIGFWYWKSWNKLPCGFWKQSRETRLFTAIKLKIPDWQLDTEDVTKFELSSEQKHGDKGTKSIFIWNSYTLGSSRLCLDDRFSDRFTVKCCKISNFLTIQLLLLIFIIETLPLLWHSCCYQYNVVKDCNAKQKQHATTEILIQPTHLEAVHFYVRVFYF